MTIKIASFLNSDPVAVVSSPKADDLPPLFSTPSVAKAQVAPPAPRLFSAKFKTQRGSHDAPVADPSRAPTIPAAPASTMTRAERFSARQRLLRLLRD